MKLTPLLSEFLFSNKQLDLAGIGRFTLDEAGTINFEQNLSIKEDNNLINYIAEKSGKMKSLAASDLDSHTELARQFLNIGKPYLFEGIGTLSKNKSGKFDFIQSNALIEGKDITGEGRDITSTTENSFTDYEEMFSPRKAKTPVSKKLVSWFVIIAGLSLAIFGGYLVYNKTKNKETVSISKKIEPVDDSKTNAASIIKDSVETAKDSTKIAEAAKPISLVNSFRFVIERANKSRAFYRYNYLKSNFINVQMDTKDSVQFNLYFVLPSAPSDTARKRDSLQRLYGTRGRTIVELN